MQACWRIHWPALLILFALAAASFFLRHDYGLSLDQFSEAQMAEEQLALARDYLAGESVPRPYQRINKNLEFYGTFSNFLGLLLHRATSGASIATDASAYIPYHLVSAAFGVLAYGILYCAFYLFTGSRLWSLLALLMLVACPFFYGYAQFYPKDVPFAALYTLASAACAVAASRLTRRWLLAIGLMIGLAASVRLAGGMLIAASWILLLLYQRPWRLHRPLFVLAALFIPLAGGAQRIEHPARLHAFFPPAFAEIEMLEGMQPHHFHSCLAQQEEDGNHPCGPVFRLGEEPG